MNKELKPDAEFNPDGLDRDRIFLNPSKPDHFWCLHCGRTYARGEYRVSEGMQMCPYSDCDGDTVMDAIDWNKKREFQPDLPEIPEEGVKYPAQ